MFKIVLFLIVITGCSTPKVMPPVWQKLSQAWQNPTQFEGMMTTRGEVWVVTHDYIPLVANADHAAICDDLNSALESLQENQEGDGKSIHNTVMQMDEEVCSNIPDWARETSNKILKTLK